MRRTLIAAGLVSILLFACAALGQDAADFTLTDLNGDQVTLSQHDGKVVLVNFWATWCPPCRKEIPHFVDLVNELGDQGLVVLGLSLDDEQSTVENWLGKNPVNYPIMMTDENTANTYKQYLPEDERGYIPYTIIVGRDGKVKHHHVGYKNKAGWEALIKPLL